MRILFRTLASLNFLAAASLFVRWHEQYGEPYRELYLLGAAIGLIVGILCWGESEDVQG